MKTGKPFCYQHQRASNSPNGNPQRLYMVWDRKGNVVEAIDEGYRGLPLALQSLVDLGSVEISKADYHATLKEFR